jgi:hypothetical protein
MVDEIKAKVTVPSLIKAKVTQPGTLTAEVESEVMLDPDVNLIRVAGETIGHAAPVPVRLTDGAAYIDPRVIENPPGLDVDLSTRASETTLGDIKTQTDKLAFDLTSNLKTREQGTVTVTGAVEADVTGTVAVSGTPPVEIKTDSVGLAKEAGGNLAAIKDKTDNLDAKLSDIKSKTDNLDAKLSDIKSKTDNLDAKLSDIKTGVDKIPATPSQEHVTADSPSAVRVTDGVEFIGPTRPLDVQLQDPDLLTRLLLQTLGNLIRDPQGRLLVIVDQASTAGGWGPAASGLAPITPSGQPGVNVHQRTIRGIDALWQLWHQGNQDFGNAVRPFLAFT